MKLKYELVCINILKLALKLQISHEKKNGTLYELDISRH